MNTANDPITIDDNVRPFLQRWIAKYLDMEANGILSREQVAAEFERLIIAATTQDKGQFYYTITEGDPLIDSAGRSYDGLDDAGD